MTEKKINIMFMIDHFHLAGGTETHLTNLVIGLDRKRFNPYIIAFDFGENPLAEKIRSKGVTILHLPVGRFYGIDALRKSLTLLRVIKEQKPDIVQAYHIKSETYGALIAKISGVRHIISSKRDTGDLKKKSHFMLNRAINPVIEKWIAVCDEVAEIVKEREKIQRSKITTIYNGVDTNKYNIPSIQTKHDARTSLGISDGDFVVGTVAWLRPEKGYDVFFEAIKILIDQIENIKFVIIGGGKLLEHYKEYCLLNGLGDKVIFTGPTKNVIQYLPVFDVACLFPISNEGFSNSIIEKMAMGLPLVVTDVGGNREAVKDGDNGFVVPPNNHIALSDAILNLYNNPEKRMAMGKRSREIVIDLFSLEKMIKNHETFYEMIIA